MDRLATVALVGAVAYLVLKPQAAKSLLDPKGVQRGRHDGTQPHTDRVGNRDPVLWPEVREVEHLMSMP